MTTVGRINDFEGGTPTDLSVGVVYALRRFAVTSDGLLVGLTVHQPVLDAWNGAECCLNSRHQAPVEGCTCGFYAYDTDRVWGQSGTVEAVVQVSGRVIVCDKGLKAQEIRPVALVAPLDLHSRTMRAMERNYPRVRRFASRQEMLDAYPLTPLTPVATRPPRWWHLGVDRRARIAQALRRTEKALVPLLLLLGMATVLAPQAVPLGIATVLLALLAPVMTKEWQGTDWRHGVGMLTVSVIASPVAFQSATGSFAGLTWVPSGAAADNSAIYQHLWSYAGYVLVMAALWLPLLRSVITPANPLTVLPPGAALSSKTRLMPAKTRGPVAHTPASLTTHKPPTPISEGEHHV